MNEHHWVAPPVGHSCSICREAALNLEAWVMRARADFSEWEAELSDRLPPGISPI